MAEEPKSIAVSIAGVKEKVSQEYRVEVVGVFGSCARGEQQAGSDVDVLVNFLPGATLLDLVGLAEFLEDRLNLRVDVVPVDALREEIKEQVLQEALPLREARGSTSRTSWRQGCDEWTCHSAQL